MRAQNDAARAKALADDLSKRFPEDIEVQFDFLPTLGAQLALSRNNPSKAIELLQAGAPTELGAISGLFPVFVRGKAYLGAHQGSEAATEFQRILDHWGIVRNDPIEMAVSVLACVTAQRMRHLIPAFDAGQKSRSRK
jgi:hypothetical protein